MNMHLRRRQFLRTLVGAWPWATAPFAVQAQAARRTVAILGDTQRGGFGHDLDTVFVGRPDLGDVVVADPDLAGRARVVKRVGAVRAHADWRTLIEKERPWLACIAMRHATPHFEIARAALEAGAHLYVEKPFVTTLGEADALLALAKARGLRIAVAHSMRMAPAVRRLLQVIHEEGRLGELRSLRAHGKQDARAGGEDLMVLGTHLMDLMRLFAGNPQWVHASILQDGRPITQSDRRRVKDDVGWVAGDHVHATFGFGNGVHGSFVSDAPSRDTSGHWGVEWVGTLGSARILADLVPRVLVRVHPQGRPANATDPWQPLDGVAPSDASQHNVPVVADWLEAIRLNREPECSGHNGAWAIEMALGCQAAALAQARLPLPLSSRRHPLDP